jgi:hypothetical protein
MNLGTEIVTLQNFLDPAPDRIALLCEIPTHLPGQWQYQLMESLKHGTSGMWTRETLQPSDVSQLPVANQIVIEKSSDLDYTQFYIIFLQWLLAFFTLPNYFTKMLHRM